MGRKSFSAKRSQLSISRKNALKKQDNVLYTRRLKTKRFKKEKDIEGDPYCDAKDQDINQDPDDCDQHLPFKLRELMKYQKGKPSIYKPKEIKYKDETFVRQGKKESDRNYIKRTTVDFYKAVEESKRERIIASKESIQKSEDKKAKINKRLGLLKARKNKKFEDLDDKPKYDKIEFGEYVSAPPKFTVKPKLVVKKNIFKE